MEDMGLFLLWLQVLVYGKIRKTKSKKLETTLMISSFFIYFFLPKLTSFLEKFLMLSKYSCKLSCSSLGKTSPIKIHL